MRRAPTTRRTIPSKHQQCTVKKPCIRLRFLKTHLSYSALHPQHLSTKGGPQHTFTTGLPKSLLRHRRHYPEHIAQDLMFPLPTSHCLYFWAASISEGVTFLLSHLSVICLYWNLHMHGVAFAFLRRDWNKRVDVFSLLIPSILMYSNELYWMLVLATVIIRFIIKTLHYWMYVQGMEGRAGGNIMSIYECKYGNSLVCIEHVHPFEEIMLDGPRSSSRELGGIRGAGWAPILLVSNTATSRTKSPCFMVAMIPCPRLYKYVECCKVRCVQPSSAWPKLTSQWQGESWGHCACSALLWTSFPNQPYLIHTRWLS